MKTVFLDGSSFFLKGTRPATLQNRVRNTTTSQGADLTPHSLDLSPVEHLWDVLDKHVRSIEAPTTPPPSEDSWSPYPGAYLVTWGPKADPVTGALHVLVLH